MDEKEKRILEKLAEVLPLISDEKKAYLLGYAEALADLQLAAAV